MKKKLRQAYIRGIIDTISCLAVSGFYAWFFMDVIEKYFM